MKDKYCCRQSLFILNQIAVIGYLCGMTAMKNSVENDAAFHFLLLSMLLWDAACISCRNIKNNRALNYFSGLLLLLGWQFLLALFGQHNLSAKMSAFLLPGCLYQSFCFIQAFLFQMSAYKGQGPFLLLCKSTCALSMIGFFISSRAFAITYQLQLLLSLTATVLIGFVHRQRVCFVLRSHKREVFFSTLFVGLPFLCYVAALHRDAGYMANMGSYFVVFVTFFSVHNIVFQSHTRREGRPVLKTKYKIVLAAIGLAGMTPLVCLFQIPPMAFFILLHVVALLALAFYLLLYLQVKELPEALHSSTDPQHFYAYSLAQIKREETLKKEFSNYLHDDVLQDLLSIKNLVRKADQKDIQQLLYDTLSRLNDSIRSQMQAYHPLLLKSLTLKENIQSLLDMLTKNSQVSAVLECSDMAFLTEPYNILVYRMIRELVANGLKHANATMIEVVLTQEQDAVFLKVSDNGTGFGPPPHGQPGHRGLASIQEQVGLLEGKLSIQSYPGEGTQIMVTIPIRGERSYESFVSR